MLKRLNHNHLKTLSILVMFFVLNISHVSAQQIIDTNLAVNLAKEKKYEQALINLSPCLKKINIPNPALENCLYHGGVIANQAFYIDYQSKYDLKKLNTLGIKVSHNHYEGYDYTPVFFKKMILLFPDSKYADIAEYHLIEPRYNNLKDVTEWIVELKKYLKTFPTGNFRIQVLSDLGHIYDNLWEDLHRFSGDPAIRNLDGEIVSFDTIVYDSYFGSGYPEADMADAKTYRKQALSIYKKLSEMKGQTSKQNNLIASAIKRHQALLERIPSHRFYIIND